jgi:hypothetical protein
MRRCLFRQLCQLNELLHTLQHNGCSPLCTGRCAFRWLCWLNDLIQMLQQNGHSPLCRRWCVSSFLCTVNVLLQEYWYCSWRSVTVSCEIRGKNMRIPVGGYVSLKPHCSEMFSWYGDRGKRRWSKERRVWISNEVVEHFSWYTICQILLSLHDI